MVQADHVLAAAEQGNAKAQSLLGAEHCSVPRDYARAAQWFRRAAEQGEPFAQWRLGVMYLNGHGVPQDYSQAARWFRCAAEQGDAHGQRWLTYLYSWAKATARAMASRGPLSNDVRYIMTQVRALVQLLSED